MPNLLDCPKTAVLLGFRAYFPSTLDIKQTVSTWLKKMILLAHICVRMFNMAKKHIYPTVRMYDSSQKHIYYYSG